MHREGDEQGRDAEVRGVPVKLTERNGKFVTNGERKGVGVSWDCVVCGDRHWVPFQNPIDGGACVYPQGGWQRTSEALETMTLTPSILFYPSNTCAGWHGYITNGELVTLPS